MSKSKVNNVDARVGRNVQNLREAKGLCRDDVAKIVGVSAQQLQKYENGLNRISCGNLYKIASYFSMPINSFFEEEASQLKKYAGIYTHLEANISDRKFINKIGEIDDNYTRGLLFGLIERVANNNRRNTANNI